MPRIRATVDELETRIETLEGTRRELEASLEEAVASRSALQSELEESHAALHSAAETKADHTAELEHLRAELDRERSRNEELETRASSQHDDELTAAHAEIEQLREEAQTLRAAIRGLDAELERQRTPHEGVAGDNIVSYPALEIAEEPATKRKTRRSITAAAIGLPALLVALWAGPKVVERMQGAGDPVANAEPLIVQPLNAEPAPVAVAPDGTAATEEEAATVTQRPDPASAVRSWAQAWSEQRVEDYLGAYASGFLPPDGMTRQEWEALRRERVQRPPSIRITVSELEAEPLGEDHMTVRFQQRYETPTYQDEVTKTLDLVWERDGWKIVQERSAA